MSINNKKTISDIMLDVAVICLIGFIGTIFAIVTGLGLLFKVINK